MNARARIRICIVGPLLVRTAQGEDLTPASKRARKLLAMLALSPQRRQTREFLQRTLWSGRSREQASGSLRQELSRIRKGLGEHADCVLADRRFVALREDAIELDLEQDDPARDACVRRGEMPALLVEFDFSEREPRAGERELKDWVERRRAECLETLRDACMHDRASRGATGAGAIPAPRVPRAPVRPWVRVVPAPSTDSMQARFASAVVGGAVARLLSASAAFDICDQARDGPGIELTVETLPAGASTGVNLVTRAAHDDSVLWSGSRQIPASSEALIQCAALHAFVNQVVDISLRQLRHRFSDRDDSSAFVLGYDAIQRMFRLEPDELVTADRLLEQAHARNPDGLFLAWRAYLRSFYLGENVSRDRAGIIEQASELAHKAIEVAPHNPSVLALASYVYSFVRRDYVLGHELAERSLRIDPYSPLARAFLGRTKSYLGQFDDGYRMTASARELVGLAPYRFTIDFLCGITAAVAGHHREAVRLGEISRLGRPDYRPPMRYLIPLYLKSGDADRARAVLCELRRLEPGFSLRLLREQDYPSTGLRQAGLLEYCDEDLG